MSDATVRLCGIAWNHTRGFLPMVATAQRFCEIHPDVDITWTVRSLQSFADQSMTDLAATFDLIVMDHPWAGVSAAQGITATLDDLLPAEYLADQADHSVGGSYASYVHDGRLVALGIDAAAPVASSRPDLLERLDRDVPATWDDMSDLARLGVVGMAGIPLNLLMAFYMVCSTMGEGPFEGRDWVVSRETGAMALELLIELTAHCDPVVATLDPIGVYERMTSTDDFAYAPFDYGYANYARRGYADRTIKFHDVVALGDHGPCRTTLGGAGLAISHRCAHPEVAARYVEFVGDPRTQSTLYFESGGQPAHRAAWLDDHVNAESQNFFADTLAALDRAYVRSTFPGYLEFQDQAALTVAACVAGRSAITHTVAELERLAAPKETNRRATA